MNEQTKQLFFWENALLHQPKQGLTVTVQYKNFMYGQWQYDQSKKEMFIDRVQCWLCKYEPEGDVMHLKINVETKTALKKLKIVESTAKKLSSQLRKLKNIQMGFEVVERKRKWWQFWRVSFPTD